MGALAILDTIDRVSGLDLNTASLVSPGASGDTMPPGADIYLRVKAGTTACVASVINAASNAGPDGTYLAPLALGSVTSADKVFGPFPASTFADPSDGQVHVSYSATSGVTVGVYRITNA
jgi:hypothetical protein